VYLTARRNILTVALTLVLFIGCGAGNVLRSLRLALASAAPLTNSLVASGAISQGLATRIVTDFSDGTNCAVTLESEFKAIPKGDPESKLKKLNASVRAARCWRVIVDRQNFAANPRVQNAANIADGIFSSLVVFYSEPGQMRASAEGAKPKAVDEKSLEGDLKKRVKELEAALKP
jgi:hypothetical protein